MNTGKVLIDDSQGVPPELMKALKYGMASAEQMQLVINVDGREIAQRLHFYTIAGSHSTVALQELIQQGKNYPAYRPCYIYLASDLSDANILRIGSADNASQQRIATYKPFECAERLLRLFRGHWESACELSQVPLEETDKYKFDLAYKKFTTSCEESMEDDMRAKGIGRIATELKMAHAPKRVWDKILSLVCILKGVALEEEPAPNTPVPRLSAISSLVDVELRKHEKSTTKKPKQKGAKKKEEGADQPGTSTDAIGPLDLSLVTVPRTWFKQLAGLPYR